MTFNAGIEAAALKWPNGCHDPDSCSRHKRCMYVQCRNLNRDIKDEIGEAVAEQNTRPSSSAPVERREAVALARENARKLVLKIRQFDACGKRAYHLKLEEAIDAILSLPGSSRDEVLENGGSIWADKRVAGVLESIANDIRDELDPPNTLAKRLEKIALDESAKFIARFEQKYASKVAAVCEVCGEPMPPGEEMFKFHGYSGPCHAPVMHHDELQGSLKDRALKSGVAK